jgi:Zn-finger protein
MHVGKKAERQHSEYALKYDTYFACHFDGQSVAEDCAIA